MLPLSIDVVQHRHRLLLVASRDVRMIGLRAMLEQEPLVRLISEIAPEDVVAAITRLKPEAVVVCGDANEEFILRVAEGVHDAFPDTTLLVFADAVDYTFEMALGRLRVGSFALWRDVTPVSLHWLLGGTLEGGWRVVSPEAVEEIVVPVDRRRHPRDGEIRLTDIERIVLHGLVRGRSERQIAVEIGRTDRTVRRILTGLETKFEVANRAELAAKATQQGFGT